MTSTALDLENVLQRLEKLEKQNRRLKCLGVALTVCCSIGVLAAAQPAREKADDFEQFVLRDKAGKQRATFEVGKERTRALSTKMAAIRRRSAPAGRHVSAAQQPEGTFKPAST